MSRLGWVGTYLPLIVPSLLVGSTGTFLLRSFFENVPKELEEAAVVDGAGSFWIYWKIFLPLARAPLSALFIIAFLGNWNDLLIGMWGALDILVDPYTYSKSGGLLVRALQDVDIAVRHAESFAAMLDALTA